MLLSGSQCVILEDLLNTNPSPFELYTKYVLYELQLCKVLGPSSESRSKLIKLQLRPLLSGYAHVNLTTKNQWIMDAKYGVVYHLLLKQDASISQSSFKKQNMYPL